MNMLRVLFQVTLLVALLGREENSHAGERRTPSVGRETSKQLSKEITRDEEPRGFCDDKPQDDDRCYFPITLDAEKIKKRSEEARKNRKEGLTKDDLEAEVTSKALHDCIYTIRGTIVHFFYGEPEKVAYLCAKSKQDDENEQYDRLKVFYRTYL